MSRVFVCLFVLFILSIAIRFGDCENTTTQPECKDKNIIPGSDKTKLSRLEKKMLKIENWWEKIVGKDKNNSKSNKEGSFSDILDKLSGFAVFPEYCNGDTKICLHCYKIQNSACANDCGGTNWCGNGDRASNNDSLGAFNDTDACCRAHDNCANDILAGKTEVNLMNNGIFTRSSCSCDKAFYDCLKEAKSLIASKIGWTYFDILQPQCFQCICRMDNCEENDKTDCKNRCIKYKWVDNDTFKKKSN